MSKYFIEVTKPSGMKTHFGRDMEERYEPVSRLDGSVGFDHRIDAEREIPKVIEYCNSMGVIYSSIVVAKKE